MNTSARWRSAFILSALLLMIGGPQHPDGTMVEMLGHPDWIPAHTLMLAGFGVLLVGLLAFSTTHLADSSAALDPLRAGWQRFDDR